MRVGQNYHSSLISRALLFLTITGFLFIQQVVSQDINKKISINASNKPLEDVLNEISTIGGIYFSYNPANIPIDKKVSIKAINKPVKNILNELFKPLGIDYSIVENQIILKPVKNIHINSEPVKNQAPQKKKFTLSGYMKDKTNGEVLIGACIYAKGTSMGTTANSYGFYSLTLPEGQYNIIFSFIGYKNIEITLNIKEDQVVSMDFEPFRTEFSTVEIISEDKSTPIQKNQTNIFKLQTKSLSQLPGAGGDIDIIKALQAVPGIKSNGDGSSFFSTRGGQPDQNLILLDEAPVYNPSHLFGFISALTPEAIKDITVYKGDAPANFGGRLSSIVDIKTKDGNMKRFGMTGSLGTFVSNLTFEGPFAKDKASWFTAARISRLNWMFAMNNNSKNVNMSFYDINTKFNIKINKNNRIFLTFYSGNDAFTVKRNPAKTMGISWGNALGTIRWNHIYNDKLFSNTTAYFSNYKYYLHINKENNDYWESSISNVSIKSDLSWYKNPQNTIRAGFEISPHFSNPGNVHFSDTSIQKYIPDIPVYKSAEYAVYMCNEQKLNDKIILNYGFRFTGWENYGPTTYYQLEDDKTISDTINLMSSTPYSSYYNLEPRLSATYSPSKVIAIRTGYARTTQYLQVLNNSISPFTTMEAWVPCGPNILPQKANQYTLGYCYHIGKTKFLLTSEAYYRKFINAFDYKNHPDLLFNAHPETELINCKSWAYGLETLLYKQEGKFTGWISYTWSRTFRKSETINNGETYPSAFDYPHEFCISSTYDARKRFVLSLNWIFHTGAPVTVPVGFYTYNGYTIPVYNGKNNERLPSYHRLDLSVMIRLSKLQSKFQHNLNINIYNLYARKNPFSLSFSKYIDDSGNFVIPTDMSGNYEIISTYMSVAGCIPSLNYKFSF